MKLESLTQYLHSGQPIPNSLNLFSIFTNVSTNLDMQNNLYLKKFQKVNSPPKV
jgi:hypothetical protein